MFVRKKRIWSGPFGTMGIQDKARHIVTLYLEDISHLVAAVDAHFGFSRYAEQLGRSASSLMIYIMSC